MSLARRMMRRFRIEIAALSLVIGLIGTATAGQFESGVDALKRGDYVAAARLLGPLAEQGDTRAQLALGVGPAVKGYRAAPPSSTSNSAWQIEILLIAIIAAVSGVTYAVKMHQIRSRRARFADFIRKLPPELLAEVEHAKRIAGERPWEPIAFKLNSIEMMERGVRFHASGQHLGHAFGFGFALTMSHGPVAVCEWSRDGAVSEGLVDIFAHYADQPRGDSRFNELIKVSAVILQAEPRNVPFPQVVRLHCKIFFEFAEDNPEIYLDLDFAGKAGAIGEKDPMYRKNLVHAFQTRDQQEETAF
jgi:hypothetical protein